jgi:imidazolonepropionase-like amidohydrolase
LLLMLLLVTSVGAMAQAAGDGRAKPLVFTDVTVIDATGAKPMAGMTVVVTGDRIAEIGKTGKVRVPTGAEVISAKGKFLIPGLWDMHVHQFVKELFLPLFIANGVTGVRDMFAPLPMLKQWQSEIKEGKLLGPRIIAAGPIVDGPKPVWPGSVAVANADEGTKAVTTVKQGGSDFVKVYSLLPREAYFAIAAEARRQGIPFAGHVPTAVSAAEASDAGQKSIEHLTGVLLGCSSKEEELVRQAAERRASGMQAFVTSFIHDNAKASDTYDEKKAAALFARFKKNGTWMSPTLTVLRAIAYIGDADFRSDERLKYMPAFIKSGMWGPTAFGQNQRAAEDNAVAKRVFLKQLEIIGAMQRAGVRIIAGTDTPNPYVFPGFSLHDELALLVKAGLTPMEALQAATRNAAEYAGQLATVGTIEKGKIADLVLLDADPLSEIANTKRINSVIVGGRLVDRAAIAEMLSKVEASGKP